MKALPFLLLSSLAIPTVALAQTSGSVTTDFINIKGEKVGTATLTDSANGTLIKLDLKNFPSGERAIHFHQKGDCSPLEGNGTEAKNIFSNAGSHLSLEGHDHGFMHEKGPHAGDIPNIIIPENGELKTDLFNERVSINKKDNLATLLDEDGAAIIIHQSADDYKSQPSGAAGDRIACAVLKK